MTCKTASTRGSFVLICYDREMKKTPQTESPTWIEINAKALVSNVKNFKKILPKKTDLMCVIKANAYGHGLDQVMNILKDAPQVSWFSVFSFEDALRVRTYTDKKILVLCNTNTSYWNLAIKKNISITISSMPELLELSTYKHKKKLAWHLKVDTGLHRQGFLRRELSHVITLIEKHNLTPEGLYSHFSGVETKAFDHYSEKQYRELCEWKQAFASIGITPKVHIAGTAGNIRHSEYSCDIARLGIGLYGLYPSDEAQKKIGKRDFFKPVLSFHTSISEVKTIPKGSFIAYDCTYKTKTDTTIAILPVGYYDGLPRTLSSRGKVLIQGKYAPILGRIMMNMCIIDVSHIQGVKEGEKVTIIGIQGKQTLSAEELAHLAGTINYELVTRLNPAIPRKIVL